MIDDLKGTAAPGACAPALTLDQVADALCEAHDGLTRESSNGDAHRVLPSRAALVEAVEDLRSVLFPGYVGEPDIGRDSLRFQMVATLDRVARVLREQVKRGLCFTGCAVPGDCAPCEARARDVTAAFIGRLPEVRRLLATDVQAAYEGDPAATGPDETIFCYPGILAVTFQRIAHQLHLLGVPLIPRIITEHAHSLTGIDIHPGASIGERFFVDHGTGVVVGETCVIGNNVRIYQGVTLGAKSFPLDDEGHPMKGIPRHPVVEDDVIIYSGATVLGRITIGRGSTIGGNVWLTHGVPPDSRVSQDSR